MKEINITENYSDFFAEKYSNNSYRNFLEDLIEYKFDIESLKEIYNDIKLIKNEFNNEKKNDLNDLIINNDNKNLIENNYNSNENNLTIKEKLRYSSKKKSKNNTSFDSAKKDNGTYINQNFESILRSDYNSTNSPDKNRRKKPFNRFGKLNGQFFEKNILKKNISSPL